MGTESNRVDRMQMERCTPRLVPGGLFILLMVAELDTREEGSWVLGEAESAQDQLENGQVESERGRLERTQGPGGLQVAW